MQRDGVHHGFNFVITVGAFPQDIQGQIHFRVGVETKLLHRFASLHRLAHLYRHGGYTSAGRSSGEDAVAGLGMRDTTLDVTWNPYLMVRYAPTKLLARERRIPTPLIPTLPHVLTRRMMGTVSVV